ncbi:MULTISPECIES: sugar O-acetyltransferase [Chryseobacterium]|uniref:Acetyltransferase n=1 Tax=Chryseobacterium camelliae TaxID=1265445 RepID=A0ABU0THA8_9FLAO|nr:MULTISPECIES: sugar O-acetyltransferase [Chryseobacterium]MDT3405753.1 maltose O-acetyltransferase [Pseudacidovorax intermedius]MDQ1096439.1 maltose O-acetyltransferase [Chryseobacterium camelliae]MDQ1100380.1 maltose O-acetyltransferase [Chryseobacterium sp. SORGH_AS_1048]MDR6087721.1 maltose O-acetyltransferase [Chryseobacterium sp. SORGH_AS_0909]MDR6132096.1 maltose O-acetyltransferase [Chryseobacterium sp. SORGH_AS_1175]
MTEKEKCAQGLLYNANYDPELIQERMECKDLCLEYNQLKNTDTDNRNRLIKKIIPNSKNNICIEPSFWCDYGYNIRLGENFYANHNLVILDCAEVSFGDNAFIGPNCSFYTAGHPLDAKQRNEGLEYARPIRVGHNVWFGGNVVVLPGITIGNNAVIGAGSVVTKDVPDNAVAVGNPCRIVKMIEP